MTGKRRLGPDSPQDPQRPSTPSDGRVGPRGARRLLRDQQRKQQRQQQRRRLGKVGIAGLVVAGLAVAAGVTFGVRKATSSNDAKPPVQGQTTVLLSIAGPDRTAIETALLAHDSATHQGVELLMPSRVLIDVCGFGNQQLGEVLALPDGQRLSRAAASDMLSGVTVDGSWVLTTAQLAGLIDAVGGVTVDVDVDVIQRQSDGSRVLVVQRGPSQRLDGARAAAFATYTAAGEDATANLVRLQQVLDGLLLALPRDTAEVQQRVAALGEGAGSTLGPQRLAQLLVGLSADARANKVLPTDLPIVKIDAGQAQSSYRVDSDGARQFVTDNLAASWPAAARVERKRVLVQNGVGTPGLVDSACTKLVDAGYVIAGSGNATHLGFATSKVLIFDRSVASAQLGNAVATALGLPTGDVAVSTAGQNVADVLVILGKDYKP